ncbi:hypothetical protein IT084_05855 [Desulfallas sp. Bu1-1]|uniref:hypothetical protein n=1 Tax=Desulfallas sp. Bu1-1 TaxID=2787620 RepID=UPI00189F5F74|nr:hypothetical protein [Desulfallas sp. Bu1-1]MBF7082502.1 hypothetical protein [Desulfallas sp. Bu1-1]
MNNTFLQKQINYLNDILADTLKSFWDERGRGARYRTTLIGIDRYIKLNENSFIHKSENCLTAMQNVKTYLEGHGIILSMSYNQRQDFSEVLDVEIHGCLHLGMESKLLENGVEEPLACPCANLIMYLIEQTQGLTTELADIKIINGEVCKLCIVIFRPND